MKANRPNMLARTLREYFADHLPRLRGMSPHTVHSYRDAFTLLLRFTAESLERSVSDLDLDALSVDQVASFLDHLEKSRANKAATRNVRLAAIHSFFRFLSSRLPERLEHCQRILGIPFKRAQLRPVDYFDYDEIQAVLDAVERSTYDQRRDYVLLATMFNTGARVQEILDLRPCDLQLIKPFRVRLVGKGRKERHCPLWPQTAEILRTFLAEGGIRLMSTQPLFLNHRGEPLTRYGVRYIMAKYCALAQAKRPTLARKKLHPHSMRHSTAIHLLKAGIDMVTISHWLGHSNVNTTNRYTTIDMEAKQEAISKVRPPIDAGMATWRSDATILDWLDAL